jgi:Tetratricopeptide repeat
VNTYWLADVLAKQQMWDEAETIFRRVLEAEERILGRDHENTRSDYCQLANVQRGQQRYEEAEAM